MDTYLGLDLGGTKLLIGEVDSNGNILKYKKYQSGYFNQQDSADIINSSLDDYIKTVGWYENQKPKAMGIGLIGRVDPTNGIWLQIDPHRTLSLDIAKNMTERYQMPCYIDNDVKSATRAEQLWGFGTISQNFIYINVGTGIAMGVVINGHQLRGCHFDAGEVGHVCTGVHVGIKCACGRTDCAEAIAAGIGFDACARLLKDHYTTNLHIPKDKGERILINEVYNLAQKGDELCNVLVNNAADALAGLIENTVRVIDPDTVVLGGGIVSDNYMHKKIIERLHPTTMRFVTNGVVITKLNPQFIGLLGAAVVAMNINQ